MMVRPLLGAISGPILGKNSAKSQSGVIFRPCTLAVLGGFGGYVMVFYGVLWCFRVVWTILRLKTSWYGLFWVPSRGRYLAKIAQNHSRG